MFNTYFRICKSVGSLLLNILFSELSYSEKLQLCIEVFLSDAVLLKDPVFMKIGILGKIQVICVCIESLWIAVSKGI